MKPEANTKPTDEHLVEFAEHVKKWLERFGMVDWDLSVSWGPDDEVGKDSAACYYDIDARHAKITLNRDPSASFKNELEVLALHEVLHLVLADLSEFASEYAPKNMAKDATTKEHAIIQRLINLIMSYERHSAPIKRKPRTRKG